MAGPMRIVRANFHAEFARRIFALEEQIHEAELPLHLYEGIRSPDRQADLYARGRTVGEKGKIVTHARPWESLHQYGMAADFVEHSCPPGQGMKSGQTPAGTWVWWPKGDPRWDKFHEIARRCGLDPLASEKPHVQMSWPVRELLAGRYPSGGGTNWAASLEVMARAWGYHPRIDAYGCQQIGAPPAPDDRPYLEDAA